MGIAPYKTFTFDGESSADYGVYITGEGVFNAPERSVEMIEIPGRNGNYALDQGKFNNVTITYQAGMFDVSESDFADRLADFRNWLCSKVGYCRLEDEYNSDEYRMATYSSGLNVEHDTLFAGEFEITFECKPQRWLKSGEIAETILNSGTIENPSLFASNPLLMVEGYGNIDINGEYLISIPNAVIGDIYFVQGDNFVNEKTYSVNLSAMNNGDAISVSGRVSVHFETNANTTPTVSDSNANFSSSVNSELLTNKNLETSFNVTFNKGTDIVEADSAVYVGTNFIPANKLTMTNDISIAFDNASETITITSVISTATTGSATVTIKGNPSGSNINIQGVSSMSALGNPSYIDCDLGECYMYAGDEVVQLNSIVGLGSELPELKSGNNTFNYDNSITELKVVPRWWRV